VESEESGIGHGPRTRLIAEQGKLDWQRVEMGLDERIHAARIGGEGGAVGSRHGVNGIFGEMPHPQRSRFLIRFEPGRTHDFGQLSAGKAPQAIHLPQPVLRGRVALREKSVLERFGVDVWSPETIARDGYRPGHECFNGT
jgi:hypothetical protein